MFGGLTLQLESIGERLLVGANKVRKVLDKMSARRLERVATLFVHADVVLRGPVTPVQHPTHSLEERTLMKTWPSSVSMA